MNVYSTCSLEHSNKIETGLQLWNRRIDYEWRTSAPKTTNWCLKTKMKIGSEYYLIEDNHS